MPVYHIETTRENMKQEALARMSLLDLDREAIAALSDAEQVYVSDWETHAILALAPVDTDLADTIASVEEEYGVLVYHAIRFDTFFGKLLILPFVTPTPDQWKDDRADLADGFTYAWVHSDMEDGVSGVVLEPVSGGLRARA